MVVEPTTFRAPTWARVAFVVPSLKSPKTVTASGPANCAMHGPALAAAWLENHSSIVIADRAVGRSGCVAAARIAFARELSGARDGGACGDLRQCHEHETPCAHG